jgi:hypothetical protein
VLLYKNGGRKLERPQVLTEGAGCPNEGSTPDSPQTQELRLLRFYSMKRSGAGVQSEGATPYRERGLPYVNLKRKCPSLNARVSFDRAIVRSAIAANVQESMLVQVRKSLEP